MNNDILVYAMDISVHFQKKAIELRREGNSYADIAKHMRVSRSAVCNWVKNVRLTEAEKELLKKKQEAKRSKAKMNALITLRSRKVYKEKVAFESAEKEFEKFSKDPMFMLGIGMWGFEKIQKQRTMFTFTASNSENMAFMSKWVQKYLGIPPKSLKIRLFKLKRGESTAFTLSKMQYVRKLIAWQKLTMLYYS
jgi:predicted transcriptional regulator